MRAGEGFAIRIVIAFDSCSRNRCGEPPAGDPRLED